MENGICVNGNNFAEYTMILHDAVCERWVFDYAEKSLTLFFKTRPGKVVFHDVYAHETTSCDYWGPSPHIYAWRMLEGKARSLYPRVMREIQNNGYDCARIQHGMDCLELEITFISGDIMTVLCDKVTIEETGI